VLSANNLLLLAFLFAEKGYPISDDNPSTKISTADYHQNAVGDICGA